MPFHFAPPPLGLIIAIMGKEIERKFLVDQAAWKALRVVDGQLYRQGYLLLDPEKTIRVRITPSKGYLTIKGASQGMSRAEFEYEIPQDEAEELLNNFAVAELSKYRYHVIFDNKTWEVDEFIGANAGLMVAEIELESEDEMINLPHWIADEVTGQTKYYNSQLTTAPYTSWPN
jgi:adenylate cyclase